MRISSASNTHQPSHHPRKSPARKRRGPASARPPRFPPRSPPPPLRQDLDALPATNISAVLRPLPARARTTSIKMATWICSMRRPSRRSPSRWASPTPRGLMAMLIQMARQRLLMRRCWRSTLCPQCAGCDGDTRHGVAWYPRHQFSRTVRLGANAKPSERMSAMPLMAPTGSVQPMRLMASSVNL